MIAIIRLLLRLFYGFRAYNESALDVSGPVLLLPNHVSWLDWLFLGVCLEKDWRFVTSSTTADLSWLHKRIMVNRRTFPVDMNSAYALKDMTEYLKRGGRLVLFPEGRLSRTGSLMKLFEGTGFLIAKTRAKVITAYLRGAHRLPFSPNPNAKRWFPRLSAHFSDPIATPFSADDGGSDARSRLTNWLRDLMIRQQFDTEMSFGPATLPLAIAEGATQFPKRVILQDATMQQLTYRRLLLGAELLAQQWVKKRLLTSFPTKHWRVGVLLPNTNATPVVILSLWASGKIPAILNYSMGPAVLAACARVANLKQIITSRKFVEGLHLDLEPLKAAGLDIIYLEDARQRITATQKLKAAFRRFFKVPLSNGNFQPVDTAVILFTSGSEGDPKGVELSHRNLLANIRQMSAVTDLVETDRFFNALPLFHSFGLIIGLFLPLVRGAFVFLYVSPLHYRVVPAAFYNLDCTVFFGTNTFLCGYARKAHPYDFRSVRYLFAGAEKLQESTSKLWMEKFGVRILEGYGATECSPCLSVNLPANPRPGSVGRLLPAVEYRLEAVEGVTDNVQSPESKVQSQERQVQGPTPINREQSSKVQSQDTTPATPSLTHPVTHNTLPRSHAPALSLPDASTHNVPGTGRLFVRGPNIMRGYLNPEANSKFQALNGWYDTGDIVRVDAEGFVYILGRLKRFAKIAGEMVSLTAIEDVLAGAFRHLGLNVAVAIVAKADEAKGEKLIAVTNAPRITLAEIGDAIRARGLSNLAVPRALKIVPSLPKLGTGKINHRELEKIIAADHEPSEPDGVENDA